MPTKSSKAELITRGGKPMSIILPLREYERLIERLEDAENRAAMREARQRKLSFRPFSAYLADNRPASRV
jgi:PHD/YefM family antitoxin component YafN of YafNO toxin-antitoxin module